MIEKTYSKYIGDHADALARPALVDLSAPITSADVLPLKAVVLGESGGRLGAFNTVRPSPRTTDTPMAEASGTNKHWILLGEHYDQKLAQGLSPRAAEQEVRRERVQNSIPCRCQNEYGEVVDPPASFWAAANFNFETSWVSAPLPPDPLAPLFAHAARQYKESENAMRSMFGSLAIGANDNPAEIPSRPRILKYLVEVEVALSAEQPARNTAKTQVKRAQEALRRVYPPDGIAPNGTSDTEAHQAVKADFQKRQEKRPPSLDTIKRARGSRND
jgi:hypothetical protein